MGEVGRLRISDPFTDGKTEADGAGGAQGLTVCHGGAGMELRALLLQKWAVCAARAAPSGPSGRPCAGSWPTR